MSVRLDGNVILMDAEPLLGWLQADMRRVVDLAGAEHLHAAVLQVLIALRPALRGTAKDPFLRDWIAPALMGENPPRSEP
jgi:hypothetical protein